MLAYVVGVFVGVIHYCGPFQSFWHTGVYSNLIILSFSPLPNLYFLLGTRIYHLFSAKLACACGSRSLPVSALSGRNEYLRLIFSFRPLLLFKHKHNHDHNHTKITKLTQDYLPVAKRCRELQSSLPSVGSPLVCSSIAFTWALAGIAEVHTNVTFRFESSVCALVSLTVVDGLLFRRPQVRVACFFVGFFKRVEYY